MIFVDSNIPMYLVGADHPNKSTSRIQVERLVSEGRRLVTNVEVLQEILHRYVSIGRRDFIQKAWDTLYGIVEEVHGIGEEDAALAKDLVNAYESLTARDALHAAQMKRLKMDTLLSFDQGFDILPWVKRII